MIATLTGTLTYKTLDMVVLDVHGVGYGILVTTEDYGRLAVDTQATLFIYEHIRENSHDLFGFLNNETKALFETLLSVSGVGPKMALSVLSIGTAQAVKQAIAGGDTKFIQQANGVGKRVAERVVVELKDKVGLTSVDLASTGLLQSDVAFMQDEATAALVALGYSAADAAHALQHVDPSLPTEERIKHALKRPL